MVAFQELTLGLIRYQTLYFQESLTRYLHTSATARIISRFRRIWWISNRISPTRTIHWQRMVLPRGWWNPTCDTAPEQVQKAKHISISPRNFLQRSKLLVVGDTFSTGFTSIINSSTDINTCELLSCLDNNVSNTARYQKRKHSIPKSYHLSVWSILPFKCFCRQNPTSYHPI